MHGLRGDFRGGGGEVARKIRQNEDSFKGIGNSFRVVIDIEGGTQQEIR